MRDEILITIVDRFIDDPQFRTAVTTNPATALAEYRLTDEESAAISDFYAKLGNPTEEEITGHLTTMRRQGAA